MSLLGSKKPAEDYGDPEFFIFDNFRRGVRIRRDHIQSYEPEEEKNSKGELQYSVALYSNNQQAQLISYNFGIDRERRDKFLAELDKLFNAKHFRL